MMTFENPSQDIIFNYLKTARRIAVVGLSNNPERVSYEIAELLQKRGYEIIPVNPVFVGQEILGEKVYGTIAEVPGKIDIVDIFRRSEFLPEVAEDFIKSDATVYWAQLGLESAEAEEILRRNNRNEIVMNRCIKIELALLDAQQ